MSERTVREYSIEPGDEVLNHEHGWVQVTQVVAHPAGQHGGPIRADLDAVEIVTTHGSRWTGSLSTPYIGSDLVMHWTWYDVGGMPGR